MYFSIKVKEGFIPIAQKLELGYEIISKFYKLNLEKHSKKMCVH